jgi:hypothetical protein
MPSGSADHVVAGAEITEGRTALASSHAKST